MEGEATPQDVHGALDAIYRTESRRIFATLVRLLGDFDRAEEALHEAFRIALERWPLEGVPASPRQWLISAGRFRGIDRLRRAARFSPLDERGASLLEQAAQTEDPSLATLESLPDDPLRLIFTCCHPALSEDAQVALTLREMCGLTTEEIARAFLVPAPTVAQRIVRAKGKIRGAGIPYRVPDVEELPARLDAVLRVVYLVFNEGYAASSGERVTRGELTTEAIRLGRLLASLMPEPEVLGLLALMLLQDSRRAARSSAGGDVVLLADQDRSLWDRDRIREGRELATRALSATRRPGPYAIQAAIAAVHSEAADPDATDWAQIVALYDVLLATEPSPIVELNRAVAVAMRDGAAAGLRLVDAILERGELSEYALAHATRADLCRRLGKQDTARMSYRRAIELTPPGPTQRFRQVRIRELEEAAATSPDG